MTDPAPPRLEVIQGGRPAVAELMAHQRSWLYLETDAHLWFALAVAVSAGLDGEPLWGMVIGPPSGGKTEAIRMCEDVSVHEDELTAPAMLSWTVGKSPKPTGVLTRIGERGFVTVADFSTVLATSDRGGRDQLFALLRRAYDGEVTRTLGNAPYPLRWSGRLTLLAACTPEIDRYSSYSDALGPRWLYLRLPVQSAVAKRQTARAARRLADVGAKRRTAQRLAGEVIRRAVPIAREISELPEEMAEAIEDVAILTAYGRGAVPRSGYGKREIEGLAVVEEPPRLIRQLVQLTRGLLALGLDQEESLAMVHQAALGSMPEIRSRTLAELAYGEPLLSSELARRVGSDRQPARFCLEDLAAIGVTECLTADRPDDEEHQQRRKPWVLTTEHAELVVSVMQRAERLSKVWEARRDPDPVEASHRVAGSHQARHAATPHGAKSGDQPPSPPGERSEPVGIPHTSHHVPPQLSGGYAGLEDSPKTAPHHPWDAIPDPVPLVGSDGPPLPDKPPIDPYGN